MVRIYHVLVFVLTLSITSWAEEMEPDCVPSLQLYVHQGKGNALAQEYIGQVLKGWKSPYYKGLGDMAENVMWAAGGKTQAIEDPEVFRVTFCLEMMAEHMDFRHYYGYFHPRAIRYNLDWLTIHVDKWWDMLSVVTSLGLSAQEENAFCNKGMPGKTQECERAFLIRDIDLTQIDTLKDVRKLKDVIFRYLHVRDDRLAKLLVQRYNDPLVEIATGGKESIRNTILLWFSTTYTGESWIRIGREKNHFTYIKSVEQDAKAQKAFHQQFIDWAWSTFQVKPRRPLGDKDLWLTYSDQIGVF